MHNSICKKRFPQKHKTENKRRENTYQKLNHLISEANSGTKHHTSGTVQRNTHATRTARKQTPPKPDRKERGRGRKHKGPKARRHKKTKVTAATFRQLQEKYHFRDLIHRCGNAWRLATHVCAQLVLVHIYILAGTTLNCLTLGLL